MRNILKSLFILLTAIACTPDKSGIQYDKNTSHEITTYDEEINEDEFTLGIRHDITTFPNAEFIYMPERKVSAGKTAFYSPTLILAGQELEQAEGTKIQEHNFPPLSGYLKTEKIEPDTVKRFFDIRVRSVEGGYEIETNMKAEHTFRPSYFYIQNKEALSMIGSIGKHPELEVSFFENENSFALEFAKSAKDLRFILMRSDKILSFKSASELFRRKEKYFARHKWQNVSVSDTIQFPELFFGAVRNISSDTTEHFITYTNGKTSRVTYFEQKHIISLSEEKVITQSHTVLETDSAGEYPEERTKGRKLTLEPPFYMMVFSRSRSELLYGAFVHDKTSPVF